MGPRLFRRGNCMASAVLVTLSPASMGPRLFRRGNTVRTIGRLVRVVALQWGHVFSDVEIGQCCVPGAGFDRLQWGHVFSDVEIGNVCLMAPATTGFNGATSFQTWKSNLASNVMFPESDGLQWGHVFSDVEIRSGPPRSGSPRMLQWGHVFSDVEIIWHSHKSYPASRFNGATSFQTWKSGCQINRESVPQGASMGPRLFRRGNRGFRGSPSRCDSCFNGATSFQTWKSK